MRILHTSDWHLGRSFGQFSLADDQRAFTDWFVGQCNDHRADLVVIAGDVYDRAVAPTEAIVHFRGVLEAMLDTGAKVAVITGNHDGADRVAAYDALLDRSGAILRGGYTGVGEVIPLEFDDGPLDLVLLPYLDPQAAPAGFGDGQDLRGGNDAPAAAGDPARPAEEPTGSAVEAAHARRMRRTHESVLREAVADAVPRMTAGRSVAVAHAFVAGGETSESERDLLVGGAAVVPSSLFESFSYTALGHLHRPQTLGVPNIRYSGTPLPYSFSETHAKSIVLAEVDRSGGVSVETVPVPVGRSVRTVEGTIDELLDAPPEPDDGRCFVRAVLTDPGVVLNAKARLARRWPWIAEIELKPSGRTEIDRLGPDGRRALRPEEVVLGFWEAATAAAPSAAQRTLLLSHLDSAQAKVAR